MKKKINNRYKIILLAGLFILCSSFPVSALSLGTNGLLTESEDNSWAGLLGKTISEINESIEILKQYSIKHPEMQGALKSTINKLEKDVNKLYGQANKLRVQHEMSIDRHSEYKRKVWEWYEQNK